MKTYLHEIDGLWIFRLPGNIVLQVIRYSILATYYYVLHPVATKLCPIYIHQILERSEEMSRHSMGSITNLGEPHGVILFQLS